MPDLPLELEPDDERFPDEDDPLEDLLGEDCCICPDDLDLLDDLLDLPLEPEFDDFDRSELFILPEDRPELFELDDDRFPADWLLDDDFSVRFLL